MKTLARGFTLIELLVVIAIIGILAAIIIPNVISAISDTERAADEQTAKKLIDTVKEGMAKRYAMPSSSGYQFWVALFVGDGDGRYKVKEGRDSEAYLNPDTAGMLLSKADKEALDQEELRNLILDAKEDGEGVSEIKDLDNTWCSWAGPEVSTRAFGDRVSGYVMASGMRYDESLYPDGFIAATKSATKFFTFEELAADDDYDYDEGEIVVKYGEEPLELVKPFDEDDD